jgi:hypothetical protein
MNTTTIARSDEIDKYLIYAKVDNAKIVYNLIKAVSFKDVAVFI